MAHIIDYVVRENRSATAITMAEAVLSDGHRLLRVNDLFISPKTHTSARYEIELGNQKETQSSSGIIIYRTGVSSPDVRYLQLAVHELFASKTSAT